MSAAKRSTLIAFWVGDDSISETPVKVIKKRLAEIDKEKVGLKEKLNALELLHPGSRE